MTPIYRMAPAFSACLRWAAWFTLALVVFVVVMVGGGRLLQGQSFPDHWSRLHEHLIVMVSLTLGLAVLIYGVCYGFAAKLSETSLIGVSFWGRGIEVPLSTITSIVPMSVEGVPMLLVKSTATKSIVQVMTLGLDTREIYERLRVTAGADHPLTRSFTPRDA